MPMFVQVSNIQQQAPMMVYAAQQQAPMMAYASQQQAPPPPPGWAVNEARLGCSAPGKKTKPSNAPEHLPDYSS